MRNSNFTSSLLNPIFTGLFLCLSSLSLPTLAIDKTCDSCSFNSSVISRTVLVVLSLSDSGSPWSIALHLRDSFFVVSICFCTFSVSFFSSAELLVAEVATSAYVLVLATVSAISVERASTFSCRPTLDGSRPGQKAKSLSFDSDVSQ